MFLKKTRTKVSAQRPSCYLKVCFFSLVCAALAMASTLDSHSLSVLAYYQPSLEFAVYRSLTFSGVIQEAKMAVHRTRLGEEVVTLALMLLPSYSEGII